MFDQLCEAVSPLTPSGFLELDDATLKAVGFNRLQVRYCRQLSEALLQGELNLQTLEPLDDATVRSELIKIKGVGCHEGVFFILRVGKHEIRIVFILAAEQRIPGIIGVLH